MATAFNFLQAEEEMKKTQQRPSFNFLEAEQQLKQQAPAPAAVPTTKPVQPSAAPFDFLKAEQELKAAAQPAATPTFDEALVSEYGEVAKGISEPAYAVRDVVESPKDFLTIKGFMQERYPNKELPTDPTELVTAFKKSQSKTDAGIANELTWALNATPEQKALARDAYAIGDKLGIDFGEEVFAAIKSPSTYVSGVGGWFAKQAALRGVRMGVKASLQTAGVTAGLEAGVAGTTDVFKQKTQVALGLQEDVNYAQTAIQAGLGAAFGAVEGAGLLSVEQKTTKQRVASLVERRKTEAGEAIDATTADFLKQFTEREKQVVAEYRALFADRLMREKARETSLDVMDVPEEVTQAVLSEQVVSDMFKVAKQIYQDNPLLRPDLKEVRVTQAVINTLSETDTDVLQQAVKRAGVKSEDFFDAFKVTLSQAGATLKEASALAQFLNKQADGDPELTKALQRMSKASEGISYWTGRAMEGVSTGARMSVAASTAGLSTAVLNAVGLTISTSFKVATDSIDAVLSSMGLLINDTRGTGGIVPTKARAKEEMGTVLRDSTYVLARMADAGYTAELSDLLLKNQPRLNNLISAVGAEFDNRGLPQLMTTLNVFNRAVDSVVRKPIFIQSVKDRMEAVGLDFEDYVANNKAIPAPLLREAIDDAQKLTFAYGFKKTTEKSFEGYSESAAAHMLDAINRNAGISTVANVALPFARFFMNAIRYTYRMTPFSAAGAYQERKQALKFLAEGKEAEAAGLMYDARKKAIDSFVGSAAIMAGVASQLDDPTLSFWEERDEEGNIKDISNEFPRVNIKAMGAALIWTKDLSQNLWYTITMTPEERAEEAAKIRAKAESIGVSREEKQKLTLEAEQLELNRVRDFDGKKWAEVMVGMGRASMSQNTITDQVSRLFEGGLTDNIIRKAGTAVADFLGRYDNVLNPLYDAANFILEDYRVVDTRAPTKFSESLAPEVDAFLGPLAGPVPIARDILQERPSLFQEQPQQIPSVVRQLQGARPTTPTSKIENELARLSIPSFSVFKSTGDRTLDNMTMKKAQPVFEKLAEDLILKNPAYKQMSMNEQRDALKTEMQKSFKAVSEDVREEYLKTNPTTAVDNLYNKMGREEREAAEDRFMKMNKRRPTTPQEKMSIIQGDYSLSRNIGFAKGGFVPQMSKLGF